MGHYMNEIQDLSKKSDLVIFTSFIDHNLGFNEHTIADATFCSLSPNHDNRPSLGGMRFNKNNFVQDFVDGFNTVANDANTLIHEIIHVLAFNSGLFEHFVDENGAVLPKGSVVKVTSFKDLGYHDKKDPQKTKNYRGIYTKNVMEVAKSHFDCPIEKMEAVFLEDDSNDEYPGSHWNKRLFISIYLIQSFFFFLIRQERKI